MLAIPGILLVGLGTLICFGLRVDLSAAGFLYLIIVVLQSLLSDFVSSVVVPVIWSSDWSATCRSCSPSSA